MKIYTSFFPSSDPSLHLSHLNKCISKINHLFSNNSSLSQWLKKINSIIYSKYPISSHIQSIPLTHLFFPRSYFTCNKIPNFHLFNISMSRQSHILSLTKSLISTYFISSLTYLIPSSIAFLSVNLIGSTFYNNLLKFSNSIMS